MPDCIPNRDSDFLSFGTNLVSYATPHLEDWQLTGRLTALNAALTVLGNDYNAHVTAKAAAGAATARKNVSRKSAEALMREFAKLVTSRPEVSEADLQAMGLRRPAVAPITPASSGPQTRPVAEVEQQEGLQHVLRLADSESNRSAKPAGVVAAQVWCKLADTDGSAPAGASEMSFLGQAVRTRFRHNFSDADRGKTAWYLFRWVDRDGQAGPWSSMLSATVAA